MTHFQILVHGEKTQMGRLWSKLMSNNSHKATAITVYRPANNQEVRIPFRKDKVAKVVGRLADVPPPHSTDPEDSRLLNGVLVQNGFKLSLMAPEDLREYAGLTTTTITCKQHVTLRAAGVELIKWSLESTFGAIEEIGTGDTKVNGTTEHAIGDMNGHNHTKDADEEQVQVQDHEMADEEIITERPRSFLVMGCVRVTWAGRSKQVELEWEGNTMNDGIADAVMAVLLTVESSPAAVKYSSSKHSHSHHQSKPRNIHANLTPEERFSRLCMFLEEQFGQSITPIEHPKLRRQEVKMAEADEVKSEDDDDEEDIDEMEARERARLASLGIPVPGLEIKVDKHVAKLWLEDLDVECTNAVLRDRVKAVVERAVETVAPLWTVK